MTPATPKRSPEEVARIGDEIFERVVKPRLTPADDGKYVAIDIGSEKYEIDDSDYAAVMRLHGRLPGADVWLTRAGHPTAYQMRHRQ